MQLTTPFKKLFSSKKEVPKITDMLKAGSSRLSTATTPNEFDSAFVGWAGICVKLRSDAVSSLDWIVKKNDTETENHWLLDLINRPNSYLTRRDFFALISQYLDSTGNFYAIIEKSDYKNIPLALHIVPSGKVKQLYDGINLIGYEVRNNQMLFYKPDEMLHLKNVYAGAEFGNQLIGKATIKLAMDSIQSFTKMSRFLERYFENDGVPPLIVESEGYLSDDSWQLWKSNFEQMFNRKIDGLIQGGMKIRPLSDSSIGNNSQLVTELDKIFKQNIAAAFGVPPSKLTSEYQNRATAEIADYAFRTDTIEPLAYSIEAQLTNFFNQYEEGISIEHVEFIYNDAELEMKEQAHRLSFGLTNRNDEREILGLDRLTDGEGYLLTSNLIPIEKAGEKANSNIDLGADLSSKKKSYFNAISEEKKVLMWKSWNSIAEKYEPKIESISKVLFDDITQDMINKLESKKQKANNPLTANSLLFDLEYWKSQLPNYFDDEIKRLILENMELAYTSIGANWNGVTSDVDLKIKEVLKTHLSRVLMSVENLHENIAKNINQLIVDNYELSQNELRKLIAEELKRANEQNANQRAGAIATTSATYIRGICQKEAWKGLKYRKYWLSRRDNKVRDSHRSADGQIADERGYFNINGDSMEFPASGSSAKENVKCRCSVIAEIIE